MGLEEISNREEGLFLYRDFFKKESQKIQDTIDKASKKKNLKAKLNILNDPLIISSLEGLNEVLEKYPNSKEFHNLYEKLEKKAVKKGFILKNKCFVYLDK